MEMTDYRSKWDTKALNRFNSDDFKNLAIDSSTIQFLTTVGLPDAAAPFISFDRRELKSVRQTYSTNNSAHNFLVDIGSDGAGDPICIDMQHNCRIVALEHDNGFAVRFVNSSIQELFAFLTLYKEFVDNLLKEKGDDAFMDSKFSDEEVDILLKKLMIVDREAFSDDQTFWTREIQDLNAR